MITLTKPTTQSLVADAYRQLQGQESTTQGALDIMNSLPAGTTLLEHQGATAAYRQAYLAECEVCRAQGAAWAWQPFGPDEDAKSAFSTLGSHYRGFPVVKVCDECKEKVQAGQTVSFTYKGQPQQIAA